MSGAMQDKTVLVTGATSGIGLEACVELARQGARVVMIGRDARRTEAAVADVQRRSGSGSVESLLCDFSAQASIRELATTVLARYERLDVLVNNAGAVFDRRGTTVDGIERTFAVNHLGYFLLTTLLLDLLRKSAPARIVSVASRAHYRGTMDFDDLGYEKGGYRIMRAYERSKLANVLFTNELARRLEGTGVTANSLHPGVVATNIWSGAPAFARPVLWLYGKLAMVTPEEGARTIVQLAASPAVEGLTGRYFHELKEKTASALARDPALQARLWAESERLVGATG